MKFVRFAFLKKIGNDDVKDEDNEKEEEGQTFSPIFRQVLVATGPWILTVSLGMTSGYSAILLPQLQSNQTSAVVSDGETASWIASIAALPMAFGCVIGGILMERFGRKLAHIVIALPCFLGWITIALSQSVPLLLIGRFLTGICGGLLGPASGVYIAETSDPKARGFLLGAYYLFSGLGRHSPRDVVPRLAFVGSKERCSGE